MEESVSWAGVAPLPLERTSVSEPWPIRRLTISEIEGGFFMIGLWRVPAISSRLGVSLAWIGSVAAAAAAGRP